jgi:hypothetical protein
MKKTGKIKMSYGKNANVRETSLPGGGRPARGKGSKKSKKSKY